MHDSFSKVCLMNAKHTLLEIPNYILQNLTDVLHNTTDRADR